MSRQMCSVSISVFTISNTWLKKENLDAYDDCSTIDTGLEYGGSGA